MEAPPQITPTKPADYLEVLTKAVMQTGISWRVVENKWSGMREAFSSFDPETIAAYTPAQIDALCADPRVIRNRRKIEATVHNAIALLELDHAHDGFAHYLKAHADYASTAADLKQRFKFLGDMGVYYFMWVVREPVPPYEEWQTAHATRAAPQRKRRA